MTVELHRSHAEQMCADTFNAAIAAEAVSAAWEIGLLDELRQQSRMDPREYAARRDLHLPTVLHILWALAGRQIVELDEHWSVATPGPVFEQTYLTKGFFYWLTRGCGELFQTLPEVARNAARKGDFARRDAAAISVACRDISCSFFDPPFQQLLAGVQFSTVADLGCGSGDRLLGLAAGRPDVRGVGIDIAPGALSVAAAAVAAAGLQDRVDLVHDDVFSMSARPEYAEVDLATCFLMGHDFWPRADCVRSLRRLRETFPNLRALILGDTCRTTGPAERSPAVFSVGFETVHAVMGTYLPTLEEWYAVIEESGWRLVDQRLIDLPAFSFIFHLTPAEPQGAEQ